MKCNSSYRTTSNWFDLNLKLVMGTFASGVGVNNMAQLLSFLDTPNTKLLRNRIYREKYRQQKEVKAKRAQSGNDKIKEQMKKI